MGNAPMESLVDTLYTEFAPAVRASAVELQNQRDCLRLEELLDALMQALPGYVMLINKQRQIVAVNPAMLCVTGAAEAADLVGLRPGEALNCLHSEDAPNGCGTSEHCSVCGAVLAILDSQQSPGPASHECHIAFNGNEQRVIDLKVYATSIVIRGEHFTVLALQDISAENRRDVLERTFFHDVLNTAGGIYGLATLLVEHKSIPSHVEDEYKNWLVQMSGNLVEEIHHQRKLMMAERGDFQPQIVPVVVRDLLEEVHRLYRHHDRTPGRELVLADVPDCVLLTDQLVLRRSIGNMVINALEATPIGGTVTINATQTSSVVSINVHNAGVMPREVQLQLFMRSFSTKSNPGRGIGTYSMKLFCERYLNGKVSFRSTPDEGTVFTIELPCNS